MPKIYVIILSTLSFSRRERTGDQRSRSRSRNRLVGRALEESSRIGDFLYFYFSFFFNETMSLFVLESSKQSFERGRVNFSTPNLFDSSSLYLSRCFTSSSFRSVSTVRRYARIYRATRRYGIALLFAQKKKKILKKQKKKMNRVFRWNRARMNALPKPSGRTVFGASRSVRCSRIDVSLRTKIVRLREDSTYTRVVHRADRLVPNSWSLDR